MSTMGQNFTKDEQAAGWPETLKHGQLAELQYPYTKGETAKIRLVRARAGDIVDACKSGELPHTATTTRVMSKPAHVEQPSGFASTDWLARDGFHMAGACIGYTHPAQYRDVTEYHIAVPAFAEWLAAQGETPSVHVAAWFDAMGIDSDTRPIVPPESWAVQSPLGLQRCDGTADGRLVRLAEIARLEARDEYEQRKQAASPTPATDGTPAGTEPPPVVEVPARNPKAKRLTWWHVASNYIVEVMKAGQYATCKDLFRALEKKTGPDSPFDKGTGNQRDSLYVRELSEPLALKTLQNNWPKLLTEAAKK